MQTPAISVEVFSHTFLPDSTLEDAISAQSPHFQIKDEGQSIPLCIYSGIFLVGSAEYNFNFQSQIVVLSLSASDTNLSQALKACGCGHIAVPPPPSFLGTLAYSQWQWAQVKI